MFEKFSISDIDSAGRGGEYTVQAGFGWTNGVVLIVASEYGNILVAPQCPDVLATVGISNSSSGSSTTKTGGAVAAHVVPSVAASMVAVVVAMLVCL